MNKVPILIIPLFLVFLISGCAGFFEFNLFAGLDPVFLPDAEKLGGMSEDEALDYLEEEMASPTFMDELTDPDNADNFDAVSDYLDDARADVSDENGKRAAILYADLYLKSGGGEELVNNISALMLQGFNSGSFGDAAGAEDFLIALMGSIVPPEALVNQQDFNTLLDGFISAWGAYSDLGIALNGGDPPPPGANMGDVAQKAMFAYLINDTLNGGVYTSESQARQSLWDMANGNTPTYPAVGGISDPVLDPALNGIFDAAGLELADF